MADWGYRVGAGLIDLAVALLGAFVAGFVVGAAGGTTEQGETAGGIGLVVAWLANSVLLAGATNGQSIGKKIAATRVVRESGRPYHVGMAFLRDVVCRLIYVIPLMTLIDVFMPLGEKRQSMRDKMASTRVLREPAYRRRRWPLTIGAVLAALALVGAASASAVSEQEYSSAERSNFIDGCSEGGDISEADCGCAFDELARTMPYEDFKRANEADPNNVPADVEEQLTDAMLACS